MTEENKPTEKQMKWMERSKMPGYYPAITKTEAHGVIDNWLEAHGNGDEKPEVIKIGGDRTNEPKAKDNGFHLTPENINLGAIDMTQKAGLNIIKNEEAFMHVFKMMKRIIVTGE